MAGGVVCSMTHTSKDGYMYEGVVVCVLLTPPLVAWGWAELLHDGERRYENLNDVRAEIQRETDRIAGVNKARRTPLHV